MGGPWETHIKSVNRALKPIACHLLFTKEALHTFICEVESILNNQLITPSSNDTNNYETLTFTHSLFGHSSSNYAPGRRRNKLSRKVVCESSSDQNVLKPLAHKISINAR